MGKKKARDRSSRDHDEFEMTGPVCRHIRKGTDQTLLKTISGIFDWTRCQDCNNDDNKENISTDHSVDSDDEKDAVVEVWMCMKCGHRGCGRRSENQHAIKHYETPRSDMHCLVISLDSWSVWCYECDDEVRYSGSSQLAQLVNNIKKKTQLEPVKKTQKKDSVSEVRPKSITFKTEEDKDKENIKNQRSERKTAKNESASKLPNSSGPTEDSSGVPVRGLSNLGNTCFFNAVIQNLSQTQMLRQTLNKVIDDRTTVSVKPASSSALEAIVAELDRPGSLTLAMNQLLNEIQESKKGVVTPQELFTQVCKKAARFKGFQQQDSQELLRYLLDGMRAEESKRVSSAITEALKRSGKVADGEELKSVIKEYEKNGLPKNFVDQVFGGEMTSTIMCQRCKTVSVVTEMFLDLSLPVSDQAYRKRNQKKEVQKSSHTSEDGPESQSEEFPAGSKYQQKKAKKQAKKQAKYQKRQQKLESRVSFNSLTSLNQEIKKELAESQEGDSAPNSVSEGNPISLDVPDKEDDKGDSVNNSQSPSACSRLGTFSETRRSTDGFLDDADFSLVNEMEKINLNDAFIDSDVAETSVENVDDPQEEEAKEYMIVNRDPELAFQTLARRPSPDQQDCTVESCLFHFTEEETLSENNSLLCVTCTKRQASKDKSAGSKKNVYTDASKQMLISSPPPVLTLHLKRFQQNGYSICKVNRHVPFPLMLDLAPFCALKSKNVAEGERQILYSLYGIVEHSGTMRSGHYTAFVKVRPQRSKSFNRLEGEPPGGSWFHISDTSVQPVSESRVQSSQAYLLFYERIR
ncbi:ubiquitin carboxyl-terminal hydrolase 16 [Syngnathoides biaculeatus]|uniref:ubiquitin carboxyl-terminal hydrolase 16 n=1 Tax=Syngnathoides biaculeatus TaxID=300417 RepID=UPI002ADD76B1|nr:ubiquitin carboxyl-terminal hydrolase 16 [Syngnathoides biaculeatus]XP_061682859.1 ubiquitin carboxyl-terminal hydrolase 16 [Syngnathoides biaculeatus]XP_061682861.1 ubiquitin carboxyl-terminal hydrolase 16 [Syngnathoides biaculeatus]